MIPLLTLVALMPGSDPAADKAKKQITEEVEKLQGSWKLVRQEPAERKVEDDYRVIFKGDKVTFGDQPACKFKVDPGRDPKWFNIDIAGLFGDKVEVYAPGIYQLNGDKLAIALVNEREGKEFQPRPKNFSDKFHGQIVHLERVKK